MERERWRTTGFAFWSAIARKRLHPLTRHRTGCCGCPPCDLLSPLRFGEAGPATIEPLATPEEVYGTDLVGIAAY